MDDTRPLARLEADGLVRRTAEGTRTTARGPGAMARAALRLYEAGAPWRDLRLPIAAALLDLRPGLTDDQLAELVEAMWPIEEREMQAVRQQASGG